MGKSIDPSSMLTADVLWERAKSDLFWFIDLVLKPVCPPVGDKPGAFDLSDALHFRQMTNLIEAKPEFPYQLSKFGTYKLAKSDRHYKKLGLLPRYHGKTRVGTVAFVMWYLLKNPDNRVLIVSEVWDNARDMLRMIKDLYEKIRDSKRSKNPVPYWVMGDWVGKRKLWNEDKIIVAKRTTSGTDPSIATAGIEKEVTSKHFDLVICDDLVGRENTQTPEQIQKTIQHFTSLTDVGDVHGDMRTLFLVWGTCWNYGDLYSHITDNLSNQYDILRLQCWDDDDNPKELLFPEKFTIEYLQDVKDEKMQSDPIQWFAQYLNNPSPKEHAIFPPDRIKLYNADDLPQKGTVIITADLAYTKKKWSDSTGIVTTIIDKAGRRYVADCDEFIESDASKIADRLISHAKPYYKNPNYDLVAVGVEGVAMYDTLQSLIYKFADWMPIAPLPSMNEEKRYRVRQALQTFVITGRIYLPRSMDKHTQNLFKQMVRFPYIKKFHLLDAFAYHVQLIPVWETSEEHKRPHRTNDQKFWDEIHRQEAVV